MTIKTAFTAVPLILVGGIATAQNVEFLSYGAGYTNISSGGNNFDILSLGGAIDYTNNGFIINGNIGFADFDGEGELTTLGLRGGYFVTPDAVIYAGIDYLDADGASLEFYNIGAEYSFGQTTVGLNFEKADVSGAEVVTTLYGSYQVSEEFELGLGIIDDTFDTGFVIAADYDLGDTELFASYQTIDGFDVFGVSGNYDLGNGFRLGGNFTDFDGEINSYGVSAGYEVAENMWIDLTAGQIDVTGSGTVDVIGFAFSFETGRETLLIDRANTVQAESLGLLGSLVSAGSF